MPFKVEIEFSGLTLAHLRPRKDTNFYDGNVYLIGECRGEKVTRLSLADQEKPHVARMAFPLGCIVNEDYPRNKLRALMSPGGHLFLEFPLDGEKDVRFGDEEGPGVRISKWSEDVPQSGREPGNWEDMRYVLDFGRVSDAGDLDASYAKSQATAVVRLDRGRLYAGEPADFRMRKARWILVDPKSNRRTRAPRIQHVSDRLCVEVEERERFLISTYSADGTRTQRILLQPNNDFKTIPITVYSLCYFAGIEDEKLDDITLYGALFKRRPRITIPEKEPDSGYLTANTHSCPPGVYVTKALTRQRTIPATGQEREAPRVVEMNVAPDWMAGFVATVEGRPTIRFGGAVVAHYPEHRVAIVATAAHALGPDPSHVFFGYARLDQVPPRARVRTIEREILLTRKGDLALFKVVLPSDYAGPVPTPVGDGMPNGPVQLYFWGHGANANRLWRCDDLSRISDRRCTEAKASARAARAPVVGWCVECVSEFCLPGNSGGPVLQQGQLAGIFSASGRTGNGKLGVVSDRQWWPIEGDPMSIIDVARLCGHVKWQGNPRIDGVLGDVGHTLLTALA